MKSYEVFERLCKERNVTPYRVCKDTGLTTASISNWKAGRYVPKSGKMQIIADYFGVPLECLTTGESPEPYYLDPETAEIAQQIFESPDLRALFDASRNASPDDLQTAIDVLMALKKKEENRNE